jgi:thiosulfate/3-mercaptopyruvate sulfurtransferase
MNSEILVSATELHELLASGSTVVVDCRFDLVDPDKGRADWLAGHIPGATYAHLDEDLAAPIGPHTGRHPLPETDVFADFLASAGWSGEKLLVAYDDGSNAISARLWWMMRYYGKQAALLDGGFNAWLEAGFQTESGIPAVTKTALEPLQPDPGRVVSADSISKQLNSGAEPVLDARAPERFSGEVEPLDTRAGHIPGSLNRPFTDNLNSSGRFRTPLELKSEFEALLGKASAEKVIHSCGSGVTACHNLFAMELAGLGCSRLYPGSWSHWIRDPNRPVATGDER